MSEADYRAAYPDLPALPEMAFQSSELTSAGVPWREVPDFALPRVEWLDGRNVPAEGGLPTIDQFPTYFLPFLLCTPTIQPDQRPRPMPTARGNGLQIVARVLG